MHKSITTPIAALAAALVFAGGIAAAAPPQGLQPLILSADQTPATLQSIQYRNEGRGDRRDDDRRNNRYSRTHDRDAFRAPSYWDRRNGRGYYNRTYRDTRRNNDSALAAGFLGFVLGAAISGSSNDRTYATSRLGDQSYRSDCARRYRSFDAGSGTYLGYDGYRRYCR